MKYLLIVDEFGSWDLFQELLRVLRVIADSHSPLTVSGPNESLQLLVSHVTVAMVAVAYVLLQPAVGGVILGSINSERYGCCKKAERKIVRVVAVVSF